jgi:4-carboxymuconolactone decarboxylase
MSRNCWPSEVLTHPTRRKAAYELYAHVLVGEQRGLSDEKLATIVAGQRPIDLTREEQIA